MQTINVDDCCYEPLEKERFVCKHGVPFIQKGTARSLVPLPPHYRHEEVLIIIETACSSVGHGLYNLLQLKRLGYKVNLSEIYFDCFRHP